MGRAERTWPPADLAGDADLDIEIDLTGGGPDDGTVSDAVAPRSGRRTLGVLAVTIMISLAAGIGVSRTAGRSTAGALLSGPVRITPATPTGVDAYRGLGAWVDVFDHAPAYQREGRPPVIGPEDLAGMRAAGVRTLYLQTAGTGDRTASDIVSPDVTGEMLTAAHRHGLLVVAWYTPTLTDMDRDLARLAAAARFEAGGERFDGLAVDIQPGSDPARRTVLLVELSRRLAEMAPAGMALGAIVPPPVLLEEVNPQLWPGFPWPELADLYDVWIPMNYWTLRRAPYDDPERFTAENLRRLRLRLDDPAAAVHALGGVGREVTEDDVAGFVDAARATGAVGASIYDYRSLPVGALRVLATEVPPPGFPSPDSGALRE